MLAAPASMPEPLAILSCRHARDATTWSGIKNTSPGQPSTYPKNKRNKRQYRKRHKNFKTNILKPESMANPEIIIFLDFSNLSKYYDTLETSGSE